MAREACCRRGLGQDKAHAGNHFYQIKLWGLGITWMHLGRGGGHVRFLFELDMIPHEGRILPQSSTRTKFRTYEGASSPLPAASNAPSWCHFRATSVSGEPRNRRLGRIGNRDVLSCTSGVGGLGRMRQNLSDTTLLRVQKRGAVRDLPFERLCNED